MFACFYICPCVFAHWGTPLVTLRLCVRTVTTNGGRGPNHGGGKGGAEQPSLRLTDADVNEVRISVNKSSNRAQR